MIAQSLLLWLAPTQVSAQPDLVLDLNPAPPPMLDVSRIRGATLGRLWMEADLAGLPNQVWTFDPASGQADPFGPLQQIGRVGDRLLDVFAFDSSRALVLTDDSTLGTTLWLYDSTTDGLTELWSANPDAFGLRDLVVQAGSGYFLTPGNELWSTDGTQAGTRLLESLPTTTQVRGNLDDECLHAISNGIVFLAQTGGQVELRRIANPFVPSFTFFQIPADELQGVPGWRASGDFLYLARATSAAGNEPWVSDGTTVGTRQLADLEPGAGASLPVFRAPTAGGIYFGASTSANGRELWFSDGSTAGTRLVADVVPGPDSGVPYTAAMAAVPSGVLFFASTTTSGLEPWISDGTPAGTRLFAELTPGAGGSGSTFPDTLLQVEGDLVAFAANGSITGSNREPYVLDTAAGTFSAFPADVTLYNSLLDSSPWGLVGGRAFALVISPNFGAAELWSANGGPTGAVPETDSLQFGASAGSAPRFLTVEFGPLGVLDELPGARFALLAAEVDGTPGLFATKGTAGGTLDLGVTAPPTSAFRFGDQFVFRVTDPVGTAPLVGSEPWITDGTPGGTRLLADIEPGPDGSGSLLSTLAGSGEVANRLVFAAETSIAGIEPWVTDGTTGGTQLLVDARPGPDGSQPSIGGVLGGQLLFGTTRAVNTPSGIQLRGRLWQTDGLPAGTAAVLDLPGRPLQFSQPVHGRVYFVVDDPTLSPVQRLLWRTDGTSAGTEPSTAFAPGATVTEPGFPTLIALGERLLVVESTRAYSVDALGAVQPLLAVNSLRFLTVAGRLAYLAETALSGDVRLWRTDGVQPPVEVSGFGATLGLQPLVSVGSDGTVIGSRFLADVGQEPFLIDGATGQVEPLPEVLPGPAGSLAGTLLGQRLGKRLLIRLNDGEVGDELFAYDIAELGSYVAQPYGLGCSIAGDARLALAGEARLGAAVSVELEGASPLAPAFLFAGAEPVSVPLGSCTVGIAPLLPIVGGAVAPAGTLSWPFQLTSNPFWLGRELYLQAATVVPGGPALGQAEVSNALEIVFGQ